MKNLYIFCRGKVAKKAWGEDPHTNYAWVIKLDLKSLSEEVLECLCQSIIQLKRFR